MKPDCLSAALGGVLVAAVVSPIARALNRGFVLPRDEDLGYTQTFSSDTLVLEYALSPAVLSCKSEVCPNPLINLPMVTKWGPIKQIYLYADLLNYHLPVNIKTVLILIQRVDNVAFVDFA